MTTTSAEIRAVIDEARAEFPDSIVQVSHTYVSGGLTTTQTFSAFRGPCSQRVFQIPGGRFVQDDMRLRVKTDELDPAAEAMPKTGDVVTIQLGDSQQLTRTVTGVVNDRFGQANDPLRGATVLITVGKQYA